MKRKSNRKRSKKSAKRPVQMSRDEVRHMNSRKRRRRQKRIRFTLYAVLLVCFIGVAVGLSLTVFFNISQIEVTGSSVYGDSDIIKSSEINIGDNLFLTNTRSASEKIKDKLPYVGEVKMKRNMPATLIIEITDTREYAAFDWEQGYVLINENGRVLSNSATVLREGVAYITGIRPTAAHLCKTVEFEDETTLANVTRILCAVKDAKLDKITSIDLSDISSVTLMYDNRIMLKAGGLSNFEKKMLRAYEPLKKENERNALSEGTLDLTIDPYAYFREGKVTTQKYEQ